MWKYYLIMEVEKMENKNKWRKFIKENGFLIFLFISVLVVASGTIFIATENLRFAKEPKEDELVILEEIKEPEETNIEVSKLDEIRGEEIQVEAIPEEDLEEKEKAEEDEEALVEEEVEDGLAAEEEKEEEVEVVVDDPIKESFKEEGLAQVSSEDIEYLDDYEDVEEVDNQVKKISSWILPVKGEILTEFSIDKLVFSQTLEEWRAHPGLDIKAKLGDKVKAPGDGLIKEVKDDDLWGITIIIDHGNGMESRISNLGTMEMVKEGLEVKQGDVISTVGDTAVIEMSMASHVHYEVFKNGKIIDPRSITN